MDAAEVVALATELAGTMTETQRAMLPGLCRAAEAGLRRRLRPDAAGYEEALGMAAAWTAAEQLRDIQGAPIRFTAGDFSAELDGLGSRRAAELLAPWLGDGFAFRKV